MKDIVESLRMGPRHAGSLIVLRHLAADEIERLRGATDRLEAEVEQLRRSKARCDFVMGQIERLLDEGVHTADEVREADAQAFVDLRGHTL
jgi:carbamoylphosphate synthase large subunit